MPKRPFSLADKPPVPPSGRSRTGEVLTVGPPVPREDNRRFLLARGLYHALLTTRDSQRLITDASSWNQKASRAFAAEFLAPQESLMNVIGSSAVDSELVEQLSGKFRVSRIVIERQLENAGISVLFE
jgi:Zn-dependent peptidase ImmA (M78 family)